MAVRVRVRARGWGCAELSPERHGGRDGGTTCPGTCRALVPLASSRHSPATAEGAKPCAEVE